MTGEVLVGCEDGKLFHYDKERTRSVSDPSCVCSSGVEHGRIIKMYYDDHSKLLIIGFDQGRVHIKKCTQGLRNSLFGGTHWRECCCTLTGNGGLFALECFTLLGSGGEPVSPTNPPQLELWCGTDSPEIEVWSLAVVSDLTWSTETVNKIRKVHKVPLSSVVDKDKACVKLMSSCSDGSQMAVVLSVSDAHMVAIVNTKTKQCLTSIPFRTSGMYDEYCSTDWYASLSYIGVRCCA